MRAAGYNRTRARVVGHREDDHQHWLFEWAHGQRLPGGSRLNDYLFAIPNGGKRDAAEAARLKAQGVKAGVSDLFLPVMRGGFGGLWIELKAPAEHGKPAGRPTQAQLDWLARMSDCGYATALCYGWRAAADTITDYLGGGQGNVETESEAIGRIGGGGRPDQ